MFAMLAGSISNIILDYIFIFPCQMGIFGAVLATGLAPIISLMILSIHVFKKLNTFLLIKTKIQFTYTRSILSIGFSSFITEVSSGIAIILFNMLIIKLSGNIGVAAYGIVANLSPVIMSIYTGIVQGIQPLLTIYHAEKNHLNVKKVLNYGFITSLILSIILYLFIFIEANTITSIFNSEHNLQLQNMANTGLKLYFLGIAFTGFNTISSMYFACTQKVTPSQIISLSRGFFVLIPMAFLLSYFFKMQGVWITFPITEAIVSCIAIFYFKKCN